MCYVLDKGRKRPSLVVVCLAEELSVHGVTGVIYYIKMFDFMSLLPRLREFTPNEVRYEDSVFQEVILRG